MVANNVDFYVTAPQKGWSGLACAGVVMMNERGYELVSNTTSSSMALNLKKWRDVMESYLNNSFSYYTTMPTDCLQFFRNSAKEIEKFGWEESKRAFIKLGRSLRNMMESKGFTSVAIKEYQAPGVAVFYTPDDSIFAKFKKQGIQVAAGVPFMLQETLPQKTFRIGLFGMEKVYNITNTVSTIERAVQNIFEEAKLEAAHVNKKDEL